jgi:hypothetical protein
MTLACRDLATSLVCGRLPGNYVVVNIPATNTLSVIDGWAEIQEEGSVKNRQLAIPIPRIQGQTVG